MDAADGQYGTEFHSALTKQCSLGWLLSYSGFLDMAIVTGTALSHGIARFVWMADGNGADEASAQAFAKSLTESIVKDFCYKNIVRPRILTWVQEQGGNADNFWQPPIGLTAAEEALREKMAQCTPEVLENLGSSKLICSLDPEAENGGLMDWSEPVLSNYSFPWDRAFEISMDISMGPFTHPHSGGLFS